MRAAAAWLLIAAASCKPEREREPAPEAPQLSEIEVRRGRDACADYRARVCEAAARAPTRADLAEQCALAPALGDAISTALDMASGPGIARRDVLLAHATVRKISARCLTELAKLPAP